MTSNSAIGHWVRNRILAVKGFFDVSTHPTNLAIFRIVVFGLGLAEAFDRAGDIVWYASIPEALRVAPKGWSSLLPLVPIDAIATRSVLAVFVVASSMTIIGFKTRAAAVAAALSGFYVLGVPQFFGKLNHNHHVVWFMAVLAASPCADALSLDARGRDEAPSAAYGFPLRVCWLLIGIIYFFPGIWKLSSSGLGWALSENVKFMMYDKWTELGGYLPFWRVDQHPWAYRLGGVGTLVFEIGFLPAMLFGRRLRPWFIAAGLAFHFQTFLFMKIGFYALAVCYVVFIDWPVSFRRRRPVLIGDPNRTGVGASLATSTPGKAVRIVATTLIVGNVAMGFAGIDSYPFAVYPRFNWLQRTITTNLEIIAADDVGREWRVDDDELEQRFTSSRWARLLRRVARHEGAEKERSLGALVELLRANADGIRGATEIRIDSVEVSIKPEDWPRNPISRKTLGRFPNVTSQ